jgi:hypothetical protein
VAADISGVPLRDAKASLSCRTRWLRASPPHGGAAPTTPIVDAAQRSYATTVWQMLETPQRWRWSVNLVKGLGGDKNLAACQANQWYRNTAATTPLATS